MSERFSITIVGGGMTGLALAGLFAHDKRLDIRVIDRGPAPRFDTAADVGLRVSALAPATVSLLDCIGAWQGIASRRVAPYDRMQVWDAALPPDGPATVNFDAAEFATAELGFIVENELVRFALHESLVGTDVVLDFDTSIESIERRADRFRLELGNGAVETDLLVAADGARSFVREALGIGTRVMPYEQSAFVTHVRSERPHEKTARQRFLPTGPIGLLPLADGRVSIVWSTRPDEAAAALEMDDAELGRVLTDVADHVLGKFVVDGPRGTFPLVARHAEHYVEAGLALVGDAAHSVHPLAGQGANLGFADVRELASTVTSALDAGEYPADRPVLRRYERARRGANAGMMDLLTGLNRLFASDSALVGEIRRLGMQLFNSSGPVRQQAVGIALGTSRR